MTRRNWRALALAAALMPSATLRAKASGEAAAGDGDRVSDLKSGRVPPDVVTESKLPEDLR